MENTSDEAVEGESMDVKAISRWARGKEIAALPSTEGRSKKV